MRRPIDPLVSYDALACRMTRSGEVAVYYLRIDPSTRRLTTETVSAWIQESEVPFRPFVELARVAQSLDARGVQLPLW